MKESNNLLWIQALSPRTLNASAPTTQKAAIWTEGEPARPGDLVRVMPHKTKTPEWMGEHAPTTNQFSGQVGTVLKIIEVSGMAVLRMNYKGHRSMKPKADITAVPVGSLQMVMPREERNGSPESNKVQLPHISHRGERGERGWLGVPLALIRRTGATSCISAESKVSDDGKFVYLSDEADAMAFKSLMKSNGIAIDLATSLIEGPNCPIDNMTNAFQALH